MPKNIVGEHFCVPETFWYEKFLDNRSITIFLIFFCLTSPKNTVGEQVCVSDLILLQNFLDNRGITILSIVFVSQYQKTCGEPSIDSKSLGHPNNLCIIEEILGLPWKSFSLTVPKNFVGERFCLSEKFKYGKSSWIGRGVWRFSVEVFLSQNAEKHRRRTLLCSRNVLVWKIFR